MVFGYSLRRETDRDKIHAVIVCDCLEEKYRLKLNTHGAELGRVGCSF
jgi:hypothetical protein